MPVLVEMWIASVLRVELPIMINVVFVMIIWIMMTPHVQGALTRVRQIMIRVLSSMMAVANIPEQMTYGRSIHLNLSSMGL